MKYNSNHLFCLLVLGLFALLILPPRISAQNYEAGKVYELKPGNASTSELEQYLFLLINQKRTQNGLPPVVWNEQAARVARLHSRNMAAYNFFSHKDPDGRKVDGRADLLGLRRWQVLGENIGFNRGFQDPLERVLESWMLSAGHRQNLLSGRWKESGLGIAIAPGGTYYFTQVFLVRK